jgi:Reverse transcriptase (RNA-dependent DNA polymerase)
MKNLQRKYGEVGYKFGVHIPTTVAEALELDRRNGNTLWYDAITKEMTNIMIAFKFLDPGQSPPIGSKLIPCHMIFTIKMDFTHKACFVAGGHRTNPPTSLTYSSVVSRESVRIAFLLAVLNGLIIIQIDIGNAYLNARTMEKVHFVTGPEFGENANRIALIVRALYGLKSSGAAWHTHFAQSLMDLGFISCESDPDVWRRPAMKKSGDKYYEYILVYVDDCLIISEDPQKILSFLLDVHEYRIKDVGPPSRFLGAKIGPLTLDGIDTWFISAEEYLMKAIPVIESRFGKLDTLFAKS